MPVKVVFKKGKGRFLRHTKSKIKGYHQVGLSRDGKPKTLPVSRLVALHYIPNPENKPEVDHIDRNPSNNHVSNLRWVTRQENLDNRGMWKSNKSGHKNISYDKLYKRWKYQYQRKGYNVQEYFKTKQEALWFKMISLMRIKSALE